MWLARRNGAKTTSKRPKAALTLFWIDFCILLYANHCKGGKQFDARFCPRVTKTKAHLTKEEASANGMLPEWYGNNLADRRAKEAADHALPSANYLEPFDMIVKQGTAWLRTLASLLALCLVRHFSRVGMVKTLSLD